MNVFRPIGYGESNKEEREGGDSGGGVIKVNQNLFWNSWLTIESWTKNIKISDKIVD